MVLVPRERAAGNASNGPASPTHRPWCARRGDAAGRGVVSCASFVAGIAQSSGLLITARGFQGFGSALIVPAALSIVAVTFNERNRALGILGAVGGGAGSVGVIASGLLTDGPGWRWVFFINVPVGIVLISVAMAFLAADRPARGTRNFDVAGVLVSQAGLDGFRAAFAVICVVAALGAVTAGVVFQRQSGPAEGDVTLPETAKKAALVPIPIAADELGP